MNCKMADVAQLSCRVGYDRTGGTERTALALEEELLCRRLREVRLRPPAAREASSSAAASAASLVAAGRSWRRKQLDGGGPALPAGGVAPAGRRFVLRPSRLKLVASRRHTVICPPPPPTSLTSVPRAATQLCRVSSAAAAEDGGDSASSTTKRVRAAAFNQDRVFGEGPPSPVHAAMTSFESLRLSSESCSTSVALHTASANHDRLFNAPDSRLLALAACEAQQLPSSCEDAYSSGADTASAAVGDLSAEELAGYFEEIVRLPQKMSSMAEMMYA